MSFCKRAAAAAFVFCALAAPSAEAGLRSIEPGDDVKLAADEGLLVVVFDTDDYFEYGEVRASGAAFGAERIDDIQGRRIVLLAGSEATYRYGKLQHGTSGMAARRYYDLAVAAARSSGNQVLAAYMMGSLASCVADQGDGIEALALLTAASTQIGARPPAVGQAWLSAVTAVAHASAKDPRSADAALDRAEAASERISAEDPPPWPWVFSFDGSKVAAYRLSCSVRTGRAGSALRAALDASSSLASPTKQAGMWRMDHATAYLHAGETERAFTIATDVLDERAGQASPRLLARARQLAHTQGSGGHNSPAWRELDERLRARSPGRAV